MRVLIAAGIYPPDIGGPATYASLLADFLSLRGHTVTVVCYSDAGGRKVQDRITVYRVARSRGPFVIYARYAKEMLREAGRHDILYAQGPVAGGLQALFAGFLFRRKVVVKVTGDYAWERAAGGDAYGGPLEQFQAERTVPLKIRTLRVLERFVAVRCSAVIVPSSYLRSIARGWGVPDERIHTIYNGSDFYHQARERTHKNRERSPVVLSIGRLVPWKGFETLLRAWVPVQKRFGYAELRIIGDGPEYKKLERLVKELDLTRSVYLVGRLGRADILAALQTASLMVLNSGYEGFSHTILEAMQAGVPVAASSIGGNTELVTHGETGLLFPFNDCEAITRAIFSVLENPGDAGVRALHALQSSSALTIERMCTETEKFLMTIAEKV